MHYKKIFALTAGLAISGYAVQKLDTEQTHQELFAGNAKVLQNIALSEKLAHMGYDTGSCGANGQYDVRLETAIKSFQQVHQIKPNGVYDAETADALAGAFDVYETLHQEFNGQTLNDKAENMANMRNQQLALMALGYDLSPCFASGDLNAKTQNAVKKFQIDHEISPITARFDADTKNTLWRQIDAEGGAYNGADLMRAYAGQTVTDNPLSQKMFYAMRMQSLQSEATALKKRLPEFVVDAMADASLETGWDLSYLGKLVTTESAGKAWAEAQENCPKERICSATGLYQFTQSTWLSAFKAHGGQYGYQDLIKRAKTDPKAKSYMLDLRKDPKISSVILIEWTRQNYKSLTKTFGTRIGKTETYMAHFLGTGHKDAGAIKFINAYLKQPQEDAATLFRNEAKSNLNVFYHKAKDGQRKPKTIAEVYAFFAKKMAPNGNNQLNITAGLKNDMTAKMNRQLKM